MQCAACIEVPADVGKSQRAHARIRGPFDAPTSEIAKADTDRVKHVVVDLVGVAFPTWMRCALRDMHDIDFRIRKTVIGAPTARLSVDCTLPLPGKNRMYRREPDCGRRAREQPCSERELDDRVRV